MDLGIRSVQAVRSFSLAVVVALATNTGLLVVEDRVLSERHRAVHVVPVAPTNQATACTAPSPAPSDAGRPVSFRLTRVRDGQIVDTVFEVGR